MDVTGSKLSHGATKMNHLKMTDKVTKNIYRPIVLENDRLENGGLEMNII